MELTVAFESQDQDVKESNTWLFGVY
jgi:hypothetical protein